MRTNTTPPIVSFRLVSSFTFSPTHLASPPDLLLLLHLSLRFTAEHCPLAICCCRQRSNRAFSSWSGTHSTTSNHSPLPHPRWKQYDLFYEVHIHRFPITILTVALRVLRQYKNRACSDIFYSPVVRSNTTLYYSCFILTDVPLEYLKLVCLTTGVRSLLASASSSLARFSHLTPLAITLASPYPFCLPTHDDCSN